MNRRLIVSFSLLVVLCLFGWSCTGDKAAESPSEQEPVASVESMPEEPNPALLVPGLAHEKAPAVFRIEFETTKGPFIVTVNRDWAPRGADRLFNLVNIGFFEETAFFRAIEGFVVQFGISGNPEVNSQWSTARIQDDPVKASNKRGCVTFAMAGPNSRTTQVFINLRDNSDLDTQGFAPIGRVTEGLSVIDSLYTGYGEMAPKGKGPKPKVFNRRGNKYLKMQFPELDYVKRASILE